MTNYENIKNELSLLLDRSDEVISTLANAASYLYKEMADVSWVGFYLLDNNELYLGPFMGLPACTRININNGVCGKCIRDRKSVVVEDVHSFPGHIACDSRSKSEICIPIYYKDMLYALLDIDSTSLNRFNELDKNYLEEIIKILESKLK